MTQYAFQFCAPNCFEDGCPFEFLPKVCRKWNFFHIKIEMKIQNEIPNKIWTFFSNFSLTIWIRMVYFHLILILLSAFARSEKKSIIQHSVDTLWQLTNSDKGDNNNNENKVEEREKRNAQQQFESYVQFNKNNAPTSQKIHCESSGIKGKKKRRKKEQLSCTSIVCVCQIFITHC